MSFLEKKEMTQHVLENFCGSLCDILCHDLGDEFYAQIFKRKNGNLHLRLKNNVEELQKNY